MKKCFDCNIELNDDSLFCPNCGKRLASDDTCPHCLREVKKDDKYCRYCGHKIYRLHVCPTCNKELTNDEKYCPSCGNKVEDNGFIITNARPNKQVGEKEENSNNEKLNSNIFKYVFIGIFALVFILTAVGFFGDVISANVASIKVGQNAASFFFSEGPKSIKTVFETYPFPEFPAYAVFRLVLLSVSYFGGLLAFLIFAFFGIKNIVKSLMDKKPLAFKGLFAISLCGLPYLALVSMNYFMNTQVIGNNSILWIGYGWGTILMIVASFIGIVSTIFFDILGKTSTFSKVTTFITGAASLVVLSILLFANSYLVKVSQGGMVSDIGVGMITDQLLSSYSSGLTGYTDAISNSIIAYAFMVLFILLTFFLLIALKGQNYFVTIAILIGSLGFYLVGTIMGFIAMKQSSVVSIGGGAIAGFVLFGFVIVLLILCLAVIHKNKKSKVEE